MLFIGFRSVSIGHRIMRLFLKVPPKFHLPTRKISSKSIYISKSTDIFLNLALEDWLYKHVNFTNREVLMLWQNEPCVVIGRHQNPWIECNFAALPNIANGVKLARRNSGGGTVYHDLGNLNLTFFTTKNEYSRKRNLELISGTLRKYFAINSEISPREDLCIKDFKISGTASKLGRDTAYHHCTLLVNVNKSDLSYALKNEISDFVKTNASKSVKSKIMNLSEEVTDITVDAVRDAIVKEYCNISTELHTVDNIKIIESVNDDLFPGISEIKKEYLSLFWRFQKTPKFELIRTINFAGNTLNSNSLDVSLIVDQGKVADVKLIMRNKSNSETQNNNSEITELFNNLIDKIFSEDVLGQFEMIICALKNSEKCKAIVFNS